MAAKLPFSKVDQIGVIVRDLDQAIKYYEPFFGPFRKRNPVYQSRILWGKEMPKDAIVINKALADLGQVELELIQPLTEGTHWMEHLKKNGEGIDHLGFHVEDLEVEQEKMVKKGFKVVYTSLVNHPSGSLGKATYFQTNKVGGVNFELIEKPSRLFAEPAKQ